MLALLLAVLVFGVLALLLAPLLRARPQAPDANAFDQAVYRDQLRELERDIARGVLDESEASTARLEIQRRLLATAAPRSGRAQRTAASPLAAAAIALVVALGSVGVYSTLGAPGLPDMPFASRKFDTGVSAAAAKLKRELDADPSNAEGWRLYARAESDLNHWDSAAAAYKHAIDLGRSEPETMAAYGEMLVLRAQGTVTPAARAAFAAALAKQPSLESARYYTALAAGQDGDPAKAIALLQALLADLPESAPERSDIANRIADAAKTAGLPVPPLAKGKPPEAGPDAAAIDAAAKMPPDQRQAMINGMVDKLANQLRAEPDDLDGWLRLGRAYAVLGQSAKAADAYAQAAKLKPDDADILLREARNLLEGVPPTAPLPANAISVLRRIETLRPGEPAVLWYLGLVAARKARPDEARRYWGRLLTALPADGEEARTVKQAMAALKGG